MSSPLRVCALRLRDTRKKGTRAIVVARLRNVDTTATYDVRIVLREQGGAELVSQTAAGISTANDEFTVEEDALRFDVELDEDDGVLEAILKVQGLDAAKTYEADIEVFKNGTEVVLQSKLSGQLDAAASAPNV